MFFADIVPSTIQIPLAALAVLTLIALATMGVALYLAHRERARLISDIRARGRVAFIDERPAGALPPCIACGADACEHERMFEPATGPVVAIEAPADGSLVELHGEL